jgi:endonuclease/exonuclease/phosphatase family metal-dependent hydrolase
MKSGVPAVVGGLIALVLLSQSFPSAQSSDIVLHSSDVTTIEGNWAKLASSTSAGGAKMTSADRGWSSVDQPLATPSDYFEATFTAQAYVPYRVWLRLRSTGNSKWSDSVWVQFSDSVGAGGGPVYRIGTASGLLVNLEDCSGCGVSEWGWKNNAWWKDQDPTVEFPTAGTKTIRVQTREDGVEIDQIVLSPVNYLALAPGGDRDDTTLLSASGGAAPVDAAPVDVAPVDAAPAGGGTVETTAATGTKAIPGTIQAEDFNSGANGSAYRDNTPGNAGGKYRATDVDIAAASEGGYVVGWVGAGEWLNYTVNVATTGTYTLTARVASAGTGGKFHVNFNGVNKTGSLSVPNTGGWQAYRDVSVTVSLTAGTQVMRLVADTVGSTTRATGNFNYIRLTGGSTQTITPPPTTSGRIKVMTWNIRFGKNSSGQVVVSSYASVMANSGADVILVQEASTWDGDQVNQFPILLKQKTGYTWRAVFAGHTGSTGEGTLILTRLPIASSSISRYLNRGFARATVKVGTVNVNVFSAHLVWSPTSYRTSQLNHLMNWAGQFSGAEIVGGDFNSWWGESWITKMETKYTDTWQDVTHSDLNGYTLNGAVRFDYLFRARDAASRLTPTSCVVIASSLSDHKPVVATYTVR